jgi:RimJ/RimL family protein N-acetyltransferase
MSARPDHAAITFVRFETQHASLMYDWLRRPHVAEWRDNPPSLEEVVEKYVHRSGVDPYIVHLDGRPIGFIQSYVAAGTGDGWWPEVTDPGVRGIDQFIGEEELIGQGVGTAVARAFVIHLLEDPAVTMLQVDPKPNNARAIRCYEKAGFQPESVVETPDGPALYMTLTRAP